MEDMRMYQLTYIKSCQLIILTFIKGLLWAMGLWTMGVMPNNDVLHPLPHPVGLAKAGTRKWWKGSDIRRT
jgi:hypothetical protein